MRQVIAPKVGAAQQIAAAAAAWAMNFSLLCSSVSAVAGYSSHANYAAGNGALDGFADLAAAAGSPLVAVQWGAWSTVGETLHARLTSTSNRLCAARSANSKRLGHLMVCKVKECPEPSAMYLACWR